MPHAIDLSLRLLGGVGLFLLGMHLMTEGLKIAAGQALRTVLARSAATRLRGVLSGAMITSLVQSSSAVTVATIGFVNAGLLSLPQSVAITYGSNIGTTMTGWLVAVVGFHIRVDLFALPAIGLGMFMRLFSSRQRLAAVGEALAGFGIFFLAIDMLREGFSGLAGALPLASGHAIGPTALILFVGSGFAATVLTQSSSAAIALVLTAAGSGVLALEPAAAMVIGANIGTTSTAVIAVIGATPNARRMAAAHVAFNLITGVAALLLLPALLGLLHLLAVRISPAAGAPLLLALFHTSFNLLGVILLWPFTDRLVRWLEGRFRPREGDQARPRYLDANVAATPVLALQALTLELAHIGSIVAHAARAVLDGSAQPVTLERDGAAVAGLIDAVGDFTALMRRGNLPAPLAEALPHAIAISRYYRDSIDLAGAIYRLDPSAVAPEVAEAAARFRARAAALVDTMVASPLDETTAGEGMRALSRQYQELKSQTLAAGSLGHVPVRQVVEAVEAFKDIERLLDHMFKAVRLLAVLGAAGGPQLPPPGTAGED